ncbi:hypothetical protein IQ07DRAFT_76762 [Pyrenochaeta sp. DS3sAY3a]|nr:hypothetical protein IQ07DRAFT_76762 [Pyrenochaeta sp. DS3sAY3a]
MAVLKREAPPRDAKPPNAAARPNASVSSPLARVMREFQDLVCAFESGLRQSLASTPLPLDLDDIRREACRLAISDLSAQYTRKYIRTELHHAESEGKRVEEQLHALALSDVPSARDNLAGLHHGYFRLYSTELFDQLGQPTELRFGTLRFHRHPSADDYAHAPAQSPWVTVELALNNSFYVADSMETLPYHTFRLPSEPSLQNRGILSRKPEDNGGFPDFDSWLLFTFLGNGCIKLEVPVEMCADVYGGRLQGRENEEVLFWGFFVDDDVES